MSARNHAVCPRCEANRDYVLKCAKQILAGSYGMASIDTYHQAQQAVATFESKSLEPTLAEYYEFTYEGNTLGTTYHSICGACGFEARSSHVSGAPINLVQSRLLTIGDVLKMNNS